MSYCNINNAKKAFSKLLGLHLNSQTFKISYISDNIGEKTLLSSIHESSDSKSDKSEEGSDSEKKDPPKKEEGEKVDSNSELPEEGWRPLQDIHAPELNETMPLPQDRRIISQPTNPQYYSYSPATNLPKAERFERSYKHSDGSIDNDNISEG